MSSTRENLDKDKDFERTQYKKLLRKLNENTVLHVLKDIDIG